MWDTPFKAADVVLRDGSTVTVKVASAEDLQLVADFVDSLSPESVYKRFHGFSRPDAHTLIPEKEGRALIALRSGRVIAHAMYRGLGGAAEVGVVVAEAERGRGLATILVGMITELAYRDGVDTVEAIVLPENVEMLGVLEHLGFPYDYRVDAGRVVVRYPTSRLPEALEAFDRREASAVRAALKKFLEPTSVAVIGASRRRGTIGGELFHNIIEGGFSGVCYPVNRNADSVQAVASYHSVEEVPHPVDLAVIAVPAHSVSDVARECVEKGVGALVVISSGFAEVGEEGRRLQEELLDVCRNAGVRLIGPNCMGVVNTDPKIRLNAQFSPQRPLEGPLGFLSQSGALGISVMDYTRKLGLGLSSFVSVGNKADISGNDLLDYWEEDERTRVILLYLESFGNPRKFARIARRVARRKPIVVVKAGRSRAGLRAAQSHTGAMVSASDITVDALFHQCGVIRTETLSELFDTAALLACQPLPRGPGVAIITNAGGAGILAADACEANGLSVPELSQHTQEELRGFLPKIASVRNPVDMSAEASAEHYYRAISAVSRDPAVNSIITIFVPPLVLDREEVAQSILRGAVEARGVTLLSVFLGEKGVPELLRSGEVSVPSYPFPEDAVSALSKVVGYAAWRSAPQSPWVKPQGTSRVKALGLVARALSEGAGWLGPEDAFSLLGMYGVPCAKTLFAKSPQEASEYAKRIGGQVALKGVSRGLAHKSDVGAVKLRLRPEEVEDAASEMAAHLGVSGYTVDGFVVQEMVEGGVEMLLGVTQDPTFGSIVACGFGGTLTELVRDVAVRVTPLTQRDVDEAVEGLKLYPVLAGYRGGPRFDVASLKDALARVAALAEEIPQILEMDINPLVVLPQGVKALDVRVKVGSTNTFVPVGAKRAA
jgi:acetyl coenzyme A synthetase (ADP forming)-like protein